jgi:hypothetical protein
MSFGGKNMIKGENKMGQKYKRKGKKGKEKREKKGSKRVK